MYCPKHPQESLLEGELTAGLKANCCPICEGAWLEPAAYGAWQGQQQTVAVEDLTVPISRRLNREISVFDSRAGLCPDCGLYLVRQRLTLENGGFFVERCPGCKGIWCDGGEWETLNELGLSAAIPYLFTENWQSHSRQVERQTREKQATAEKLGQELAQKVFELASLLEDHPNGDFGVAYLMRRFEQ